MPAPLFLASRSPRRVQLLQQLDVAVQTLAVDVIEQPSPGEGAETYVRRLALAKARAGLAQVAAVPGARVIGADTEVVLDGLIFGKPADAEQARAMLMALSGHAHKVLTAVAVVGNEREVGALCVSIVRFARLDPASIDAYIATGEPFGKAGGYAIQGRAAAFIAHLEGSFSGVMGLPLYETARLLAQMPGRA
ncbi:MAG: Maf family protein [Xanthomonadales bacterium]|nr:Maf family protein [Xanthomonadales bacterium]